jgi:hypothetical protein
VRRGPWTIFWKGETELGRVAAVAEMIAALPASFVGDDDG